MRKIKLDYYKKSTGKWYSSGEVFFENGAFFYDMLDVIEDKLKNGRLPGLADGHSSDYIVLVVDNELSHLLGV